MLWLSLFRREIREQGKTDVSWQTFSDKFCQPQGEVIGSQAPEMSQMAGLLTCSGTESDHWEPSEWMDEILCSIEGTSEMKDGKEAEADGHWDGQGVAEDDFSFEGSDEDSWHVERGMYKKGDDTLYRVMEAVREEVNQKSVQVKESWRSEQHLHESDSVTRKQRKDLEVEGGLLVSTENDVLNNMDKQNGWGEPQKEGARVENPILKKLKTLQVRIISPISYKRYSHTQYGNQFRANTDNAGVTF